MRVDIPKEFEQTFQEAAGYGYLNLNWDGDHGEYTLTDLGKNLFLQTIQEATNVPDDPIALQAQVEMWKERALKAEAKTLPTHIHDIDPSCREYSRQGITLGACVLRELKERETP